MSHFDEVAKNWDEKPSRLALAKAVSDAMEEAVDFSGKDLLELGCGTGLVGLSFATVAKRLNGVDSSEKMVEVFNQKAKDLGLTNAKAERKDFFTDELEKADIIFSSMVMHHIEDNVGAVKRSYELLKSGGKLLIADLDEEDGSFHTQGNEGVHHFGFNKENLKKELENAGFKNIIFRTAYNMERDNDRVYEIFLCVAERP